MIGIHPVHRRLAEIHAQAMSLGGYEYLPCRVKQEYVHCIRVNADLVRKLDELKQLAYVAQIGGDMEWVQEICRQIDDLETTMI